MSAIVQEGQTNKTKKLLPPCEICGLPARNVYPASNGKDYDLCDTHLYKLLNYITAWNNARLQTKLNMMRQEMQNAKVVA